MTDLNLSSLKILIVEDSQQMRALLQTVLQAIGFVDIFTAEDGESGFALYMDEAPDIVITDGAMAPIDGYELTNRIRSAKNNPNPYVPIIMLSGHSAQERVDEARVRGVTEFLAKPVSWEMLCERLNEIVSKPSFFVRTPTYLGPDRRGETRALH